MPELQDDFPRAWVEFTDPADSDQLIRADLTWLTSDWHCIYGAGCGSIDADIPFGGCCTFGAHLADDDDRKRVTRYVKQLTDEDWQEHPGGQVRKKDWLTRDDEGEAKTDVVDGACIFLNGPDHPGGPGCALHVLAQRLGVSHVETKPDVCWQLPIRREYDERERADGETKTVIVITEYVRGMWGAGGHDLNWYCSSNTEAHTASEPVFRNSRDELVELLGEDAYKELADLCEQHVAMTGGVRKPLPLTVVHPATLAARSRE